MARFEIHMGIWHNDTDWYVWRDGHWGSSEFSFKTDDEGQAYRIFDAIAEHMYRPWHDTVMGLYLYEMGLWYKGVYHPEWKDGDFQEVSMRWYIEDYEKDTFELVDIPIYKKEW